MYIIDTEDQKCYSFMQAEKSSVIGVFAGYYDFGKGPEPAAYSFNTDDNKVNLLPLPRNNRVYYGWHVLVAYDSD